MFATSVSKTIGDAEAKSFVIVNDSHSQLNETRMRKIVYLSKLDDFRKAIEFARKNKVALAICGAKHAGGAQQFATDGILVDTSKHNRILNLDRETGLLEVQSGITWNELLSQLFVLQNGFEKVWTVKQKQTGADTISIGGTLSANAHGQGLNFKPFISDVESFTLLNAQGELLNCSRAENSELFKLAIGGYGLFGLINTVKLRLVPREKLERVVEMIELADLNNAVNNCMEKGYLYGDYKINLDDSNENYLRNGFLCSYKPAPVNAEVEAEVFSTTDWLKFAEGAHVDMPATYQRFMEFCKASSGKVNWSEAWQVGPYVRDYHRKIDVSAHASVDSSEVLSEIYVPRDELADFMEEVRRDFLARKVKLIFSVIRFIQRDDESFLPWAKQSYACMILNLHTTHSEQSIIKTAEDLQRLIDLAIKYGGSYYLTYTKFPRRDQLVTCYPQFREFLQKKLKYDPDELFQSDWYRHYKNA